MDVTIKKLHVHICFNSREVVDEIKDAVRAEIKTLGDRMEYTIQEVKQQLFAQFAADLSVVSGKITTEGGQVTSAIVKLKDQLAAGKVVTQADLDDILAGAKAFTTSIVAGIESVSTVGGADEVNGDAGAGTGGGGEAPADLPVGGGEGGGE